MCINNLESNKNIIGKILVIDDDDDIIFAVDDYLSKKGFEVIGCTTGEEGLSIAKRQYKEIDVILLDIMMPNVSGYETLKWFKEFDFLEIIPIIMLTSVEESETKFKAYELGADDFIKKPFDDIELEVRIKSFLRIKRQQERLNQINEELSIKVRENERYKEIVKNTVDSIVLMDSNSKIILSNPAFANLVNESNNDIVGKNLEEFICKIDGLFENNLQNIFKRLDKFSSWEGELISKDKDNSWIASTTITPIPDGDDVNEYAVILHDLSRIKELEMQVFRTNIKLREANIETIFRLAFACEARDDDTGQHIKRIAGYSYFIAKELGFSDEDSKDIGYSSMMHDVGKIKVPDSILKKPGRPLEDEWEILKRHTIYGVHILGKDPFFERARKIARWHHERWDGKGYPDGKISEEIPIEARIVAITDVYDALTHERIYKHAWTKEEAFEYMINEFGTHFDPQLKYIFKKLYKNGLFDATEEKFNNEKEITKLKLG